MRLPSGHGISFETEPPMPHHDSITSSTGEQIWAPKDSLSVDYWHYCGLSASFLSALVPPSRDIFGAQFG